jgi:hypothetical protein
MTTRQKDSPVVHELKLEAEALEKRYQEGQVRVTPFHGRAQEASRLPYVVPLLINRPACPGIFFRPSKPCFVYVGRIGWTSQNCLAVLKRCFRPVHGKTGVSHCQGLLDMLVNQGTWGGEVGVHHQQTDSPQEVYTECLVHRSPGDASTLSKMEEPFREIVGGWVREEESGATNLSGSQRCQLTSFTRVTIGDLKPHLLGEVWACFEIIQTSSTEPLPMLGDTWRSWGLEGWALSVLQSFARCHVSPLVVPL